MDTRFLSVSRFTMTSAIFTLTYPPLGTCRALRKFPVFVSHKVHPYRVYGDVRRKYNLTDSKESLDFSDVQLQRTELTTAAGLVWYLLNVSM